MPDHVWQGLNQIGRNTFLNMLRSILLRHHACVGKLVEIAFVDTDGKCFGVLCKVTCQDCNDQARVQTTAEEGSNGYITEQMRLHCALKLFAKSLKNLRFRQGKFFSER